MKKIFCSKMPTKAEPRGMRIGRPTISAELQEKIADRSAKVGSQAAAKELGVDRKAAMKYAQSDNHVNW
jgi:hypothetical protein